MIDVMRAPVQQQQPKTLSLLDFDASTYQIKDSNVYSRSFHIKIFLIQLSTIPASSFVETVIVLVGDVVDIIRPFRKFIVVDYKIASSDCEESQFGQINITRSDKKTFHIVNIFRLETERR